MCVLGFQKMSFLVLLEVFAGRSPTLSPAMVGGSPKIAQSETLE